jgi:hypothetical protein
MTSAQTAAQYQPNTKDQQELAYDIHRSPLFSKKLPQPGILTIALGLLHSCPASVKP